MRLCTQTGGAPNPALPVLWLRVRNPKQEIDVLQYLLPLAAEARRASSSGRAVRPGLRHDDLDLRRMVPEGGVERSLEGQRRFTMPS